MVGADGGWGQVLHCDSRNVRPDPGWRLAGGSALGRGVDRVEGLARGHEQAVALGPAEADVAADLGQPNASDELALRVPHRDATVTDRAPRVAGAPQVAVHVGAHAVRPALHSVDHEIAEELAIG